jgi:hypothetical protein
MRRLGKVGGGLLLGAVVTGMTLWGMGALYYSPLPTLLRPLLALAFGLATAGAFLGLRRRRRTLLVFGLVWGALALWWSTIPASNSRDWQPDVAVLPSATLDGNRVTLHNIRNVAYRTETDFTPRYYDKTFDLEQLDSSVLADRSFVFIHAIEGQHPFFHAQYFHGMPDSAESRVRA